MHLHAHLLMQLQGCFQVAGCLHFASGSGVPSLKMFIDRRVFGFSAAFEAKRLVSMVTGQGGVEQWPWLQSMLERLGYSHIHARRHVHTLKSRQ